MSFKKVVVADQGSCSSMASSIILLRKPSVDVSNSIITRLRYVIVPGMVSLIFLFLTLPYDNF